MRLCHKTFHLNNVGEFISQAFNDYCMLTRIIVEKPISHIHTQNGLAKSFIKHLQFELMFQKDNLSVHMKVSQA